MSFGLRDYFIAFILAGAVIGLFSIATVSVATKYNNPGIIDPDFESKYSKFNDYTSKIETAKDSLSSEGGIQVVNIGFGIFQASYAFFQLILSSFGLIGEPLESFTDDFSVPFQVSAILFTAFSAILILTLIIRIFSSISPGRW